MNENFGLLYARPSFIEGISRILDFAGNLNQYNTSPSGEDADFNALREDWRSVARDLGIAIDEYAKPAAASKSK